MEAADVVDVVDVVDLAFALRGEAVPEDYADALWRALAAALPWLAEDELLGVHPLARISPAQGRSYLSSHTRLTLRLGRDKVAQARALCGMRLEMDPALEVGEAKERPLTPAKVMYSPFVTTGDADEQAFVAECKRQLAELGVDGQTVVGKVQGMRVGGEAVTGFSLMLHDLRPEHSLRLQRAGLGLHRKRGCGLFVQHKSIAPLSGD
jgi:CRISPR-associated protein Cas6